MMMPSKFMIRPHRIKAAEMGEDWQWSDAVSVVRADIAEELARAIGDALTANGSWAAVDQALARYNEATKCSQ